MFCWSAVVTTHSEAGFFMWFFGRFFHSFYCWKFRSKISFIELFSKAKPAFYFSDFISSTRFTSIVVYAFSFLLLVSFVKPYATYCSCHSFQSDAISVSSINPTYKKWLGFIKHTIQPTKQPTNQLTSVCKWDTHSLCVNSISVYIVWQPPTRHYVRSCVCERERACLFEMG